MIKNLLRGDDGRKSRLHDGRNNPISFGRLLRNGPKALKSWLEFKLFNKRKPIPWISYDACRINEKRLCGVSGSVLEFGSGMSTFWFAARAEKVCSVEHNPEWYELVKSDLPEQVDYQLRKEPEEYTAFKEDDNERHDHILIDGPSRAECFRNHKHLAKPGRIIFRDNSGVVSSTDMQA